jgi:metal-responsive CopG/Arc/MetJ family transcriptional regulator
MLRNVVARKLFNFLIDADLADALKALKARDGAPESETVRRAVREYLERQGILKTERKQAATRKRS